MFSPDPIAKTPRDKKYLQYIKEQPCAVSNADCKGDVVPAHTIGRGAKGMKRTDYGVIPLCHHHHLEQHRGDKSFAKRHDLNVWKIAFKLYHKYTTGVPA